MARPGPKSFLVTQVAEERKADLARMYSLFARVQALDAMRVAFKEHIKKMGLALVLDEEKVRPTARRLSQCLHVQIVSCIQLKIMIDAVAA